MSKYAVIGNPVNHSKSPKIHSLFAEQTKEVLTYTAEKVLENNFAEFVNTFFESGGQGLNVTVPHKETAFAFASNCTEKARLAKAVNTLYIEEGKICGANTDGIGLITDIKVNHNFNIENKRILLLGAGGAIRGVLATLIDEKPGSITILNRTVARAEKIKQEFADYIDVDVFAYEGFSGSGFDLIINGTASSLEGELPPISSKILSANCCCYDLMYSDTDTVFVSWAKANGATLTLDGLGMLVEQAAESFKIWRGVRPDTAAVIATLSNQAHAIDTVED